jgi:hypothetical protein
MELQLINNEPSPVVEITHSYSPSQGLSAIETDEISTAKPFQRTIAWALEGRS